MTTLSRYATIEERAVHALATLSLPAVRLALAYRKIGGLHFLKLGRLTVSWSVSRPKGELGRRR